MTDHALDPASDPDLDGLAIEPLSQWELAKTRFLRHRLAMVSTVILIIIVGSAIFADLLPLEDPTLEFVDTDGRPLVRVGPRASFIFGTDTLGRDLLARVIYGSRASLIVAGVAALFAALLGTTVGAVAGFYGGTVDQVLMRFTDLALSLPFLPVAIVAAAVFGGGLWMLALLLALFFWGGLARIVRAELLSLREKEFVEAARAAGSRDRQLIFRHLLPNALSPIIVTSTLIVGAAIMAEATLSFLGFGVKPPTPSWGAMVSEGARLWVSSGSWWLVMFPGLALTLTVLAVNFIGDGLRDALDPTQTIEQR
jgi:peptide/nickel transport system permease protein